VNGGMRGQEIFRGFAILQTFAFETEGAEVGRISAVIVTAAAKSPKKYVAAALWQKWNAEKAVDSTKPMSIFFRFLLFFQE
jgi:hypothetical protein